MIPAGVGRIVISGHMRGGDAFSFGWWGEGANFATNAGCKTICEGVHANLLHQPVADVLNPMCSTATGYDMISVYGYPDGGPTSGAMAEESISDYGGSSNISNPNQLCVVASLLTGQPGRRHRGRMYLPADGQALFGGQMNQASCANIAEAIVGLIAPGAGSGPGPIVLSQVAGTHLNVTSVRVDSRIDIQRRRAAQETINFSASANI